MRGRLRAKIINFFQKKNKIPLPAYCSIEETIRLMQNGYSISRFGDGEMAIMIGHSLAFQKFSPSLAERLKEIIKYTDDKFLPCLVSFKNEIGPFFYRFYSLHLAKLKNFFNYSIRYGNPMISRLEGFLTVDIKEYRKIWNDRKVVFVFSSKGRFEIEAALFDNIKEYKTIDIPPKNAFDEYDRIFREAKQFSKDYLFLIAAGATASVLAYDLYKDGYQAIDIGHLPNSYKNAFFKNSLPPEKLPIVKE
jgi:glycosyltransferase family protein